MQHPSSPRSLQERLRVTQEELHLPELLPFPRIPHPLPPWKPLSLDTIDTHLTELPKNITPAATYRTAFTRIDTKHAH